MSEPLHESGAVHGIEERRQRQRQEARRAILDATEALLVESDGGDFSIRQLGQRCGYSAPTVYHYFGDKDGLIDAVLEERASQLADQLEGIKHRDPRARLCETLLAFVRYSEMHPTFSQLLRSVSSKGEVRRPEALERVRACVRTPLEVLDREGRLGGLDLESAGQMLWALLHGLMSLRVLEPEVPWKADLPERAFDALLQGMTDSNGAGPR